jgi:CheY-like chemotaxis protein
MYTHTSDRLSAGHHAVSTRQALVVDDSRSARFALRKMLEQHGYAVSLAASANEAFSSVAEARPDIVFMDHVMPDMDGFEALLRLKSTASTVTIPVVICSSNEGEGFVRQARSRGAAGVLHKPPSSARLRQMLEEMESLSAALTAPRRQAPAPTAVSPASSPALPAAPEPALPLRPLLRALRDALECAVWTAQMRQAATELGYALEQRSACLDAAELRQQQLAERLAAAEQEIRQLQAQLAQGADALLKVQAERDRAMEETLALDARLTNQQIRMKALEADLAARASLPADTLREQLNAGLEGLLDEHSNQLQQAFGDLLSRSISTPDRGP